MKAVNSFRKRMTIVLIAFSIAPLLILGIYAYESLSINRESNSEESFFITLRNDLKNWQLWSDELRLSIVGDSKIYQFADKPINKQQPHDVQVFYSESPEYMSLFNQSFKNRHGRYAVTFDPIFKAGQIDEQNSKLKLSYYDYDEQKGKSYFIQEHISVESLKKQIELNLEDSYEAYSFYLEDRIIFSEGNIAPFNAELAYHNQDGYAFVEKNDRKYMGIYIANDALKIGVAAFRDYSVATDSIQVYKEIYFKQIAGLGLLGIAIAILLARQIQYPINKMKEAVEEILQGNKEKRIEIVEQDEFGIIYEAFNRMAEIETDNYKRILESSESVAEHNKNLIGINLQLESSYELLNSTKDKLLYSQTKHKALINNIDEIIFTMDENFKIQYVNDIVYKKVGYKPEELIGTDLREWVNLIQEEESLDDVLYQMKYIDVDHVNLCFHKKDSEDQEIVILNTKRIFDGFELSGIQGFARSVSDDWILHHKTLKRNREMEITSQISWVLANNIQLGDLLEQIIKKIEQLLHPDLCLIGLKEDEDLFNVTASGGIHRVICGHIEPLFNLGTFKSEMKSGKKVIRDSDISKYFKFEGSELYEVINDVVIIPIAFDKKVIGYFSVASSKELSESDLKVLQIFANQSAIAIDKGRLYEDLKQDYLNTIRVLVTAVEAKDSYTEGHSYRVSKFSRLIADAISEDSAFCEDVEIAGILHDIGKIGIYDRILTKTGKLTNEEFEEIQKHPMIGEKIVKPIELNNTILDAVLLHHKRYDLKGYPKEIEVDELCLSAGIIGVADALDAITSKRSYSSALGLEYAMEELNRHIGTQFHPLAIAGLNKVYEVESKAIEEIIKIKV